MASNIDTAVPSTGSASTASVRANFVAAKDEIEALQSGKANVSGASFTGSVTATSLGVGTTTATQPLQVGDGSGTETILISASPTTVSRIFFGDTDSPFSGQIAYLHSSDSLQFYTDGTVRFTIDSLGRVILPLASLPTSDPGVSGALWMDATAGRVLKVSAG